MITIGEAVTISAPVKKIFTYISTLNNLPAFWPRKGKSDAI